MYTYIIGISVSAISVSVRREGGLASVGVRCSRIRSNNPLVNSLSLSLCINIYIYIYIYIKNKYIYIYIFIYFGIIWGFACGDDPASWRSGQIVKGY